MGAKDPRVDAYIAKAPAFAKPILTELRATVHGACPDVEEGIKWGHVHFGYRGMMCGMAAFKQHATFMFWKQKLVFGADDTRWSGELSKLTTKADLPAKRALAGYIRKAMALNDAGVKIERVRREPAPIRVPADLASALKRNGRAQTAFNDFSPSHKREYIEWLTEARSDETRTRRLMQAVEWIAEGKSRNWKYEKRA